jgi:hypothetical protein
MGPGLSLATFVVVASVTPVALSQLEGIALLDSPNYIILPLAATQCQPFLIFYNVTAPDAGALWLLSPQDVVEFGREFGVGFASIDIPVGTGYLLWICNIPAGDAFIAQYVNMDGIEYIVQQSGNSSCLGNVTASFSSSGISYNIPEFLSYTTSAPTAATTLPPVTLSGCVFCSFSPYLEAQPVVSLSTTYPTGSFSTATLK